MKRVVLSKEDDNEMISDLREMESSNTTKTMYQYYVLKKYGILQSGDITGNVMIQ